MHGKRSPSFISSNRWQKFWKDYISLNSAFEFLEKILSPGQSGSRLNESFEVQESIALIIYVNFDQSPSLEVSSNVLEISKVWHEWLLCKLKTVEISGESQQLFKVFLSNSLQKKILNRQSSN